MTNIRKIRANSAEVHERYIHVEQHSLQPLGAIIGSIIGLFLASIASQDMIIASSIILICAGVFAALFPGKVIRDIPEADVVEIKRYPDEDRVTVVLDDERVKRK